MRWTIPWLACALAAAPVPDGASPAADPAELSCKLQPLAPALTYRLVYRAGYTVTLPMDQLEGHEPALKTLLRVTPKDTASHPLQLEDVLKLPVKPPGQDTDPAKFEAQVAGEFYLGPGAYHAELVLTDARQHSCRRQWDLELKPHKDLETSLAPGQLAAIPELSGPPQSEARGGTATVFLNAGSQRGNPVLLASLAAMLDRIPFRQVEVVVFSLDQHKQLLRQEVRHGDGMRKVAEALSGYNPGVVSYQVLQDPAGHRDFLWRLLAQASVSSQPPDAVFFMGFATFDDRHVYAPPSDAEGTRKTVYAYLDFAHPGSRRFPAPGPGRRRPRIPPPEAVRRPPAPMSPDMPDAISRVVKASSGKVYPIHSPEELAAAFRKVAGQLKLQP